MSPDEQRSTTNGIGETMKGFGARRIRVKIAEVWQTPALHVLLTHEDDVVVARCLDFTVSSHGENEREALTSLAAAKRNMS